MSQAHVAWTSVISLRAIRNVTQLQVQRSTELANLGPVWEPDSDSGTEAEPKISLVHFVLIPGLKHVFWAVREGCVYKTKLKALLGQN